MKLRLSLCFLAVAALLMPGAKAAQYGDWNSTPIGGGGYLLNTVFCASNPEVVYCNSDVGGLFKSEDGGTSWKMIHGNAPSPLYFVRGIDVDPRNADIVLAAVGEQWGPRLGVYRTADGGKSWKMVCPSAHYGNSENKQGGNVFARNPAAPDTAYMASSDGIFVSRDNGVSWKKLGHAGYGISALVIDRANPTRLWLCAQPLKVRDHVQTVDQSKAIKTIKGKISDIDKMRVDEQKKAVRSGYDIDILPPDLVTFSKDATALLTDLQSRNEGMGYQPQRLGRGTARSAGALQHLHPGIRF